MKNTRLTALFMALLLCGANAAACGSGAKGAADTTTDSENLIGGGVQLNRPR